MQESLVSVREGFEWRRGDWVLRLSLLLQAKKNLRAVWKFYIHWTVPCSITLPFHLASSSSCNSSALPSYHGLHGFLMSPLWFIWAVLPVVASQTSYHPSVLSVVPVFYPFSWLLLSLLWVIRAVILDKIIKILLPSYLSANKRKVKT